MRSIPFTIPTGATNGKQAARQTFRILTGLALLGLSACAGSGVRNTSRSFTTVVVDAGHGGQDAGTRSSRLILEKDAALDIARDLNSRLQAAGFHTVLTRKGDYFITLDDRVRDSNSESNAIFVSVHLNEARSRRDIHGVETYYTSSASQQIAQRILRHVGSLPGEAPRGLHTARFHVLRLNRNPAVLVECGYLSNAAEAARFAQPAYRAQVAGAISDALVEQKRGR